MAGGEVKEKILNGLLQLDFVIVIKQVPQM